MTTMLSTDTLPRLRIAEVLVSDAWGSIDIDRINQKGLGGRETAVIRLAQEWAKAGHWVEIFCPVEQPLVWHPPEGDGVVEFIDIRAAQAILSATKRDVIVSWEETTLFGLHDVCANSLVRLVGMQVAHCVSLRPEHTPGITGWVCLSDWAADFLCDFSNNLIARDDVHVVPNGVDMKRYPFVYSPREKISNKTFLYSSSPDRGLHHLLSAWPTIRKEIPGAELNVCYGLDKYLAAARWGHNYQGEIALQIEHGIKQSGVVNHGLVGQNALAELQSMATLVPYPCDTAIATETGCITVTEALAAGTPVVTTDCDCLPSEYGDVARIVNLPFDTDRFVGSMMEIIEDTDVYLGMQLIGRKFAEERTWEKTSQRWLSVIAGLLNITEASPSTSTSRSISN